MYGLDNERKRPPLFAAHFFSHGAQYTRSPSIPTGQYTQYTRSILQNTGQYNRTFSHTSPSAQVLDVAGVEKNVWNIDKKFSSHRLPYFFPSPQLCLSWKVVHNTWQTKFYLLSFILTLNLRTLHQLVNASLVSPSFPRYVTRDTTVASLFNEQCPCLEIANQVSVRQAALLCDGKLSEK